MTDGTLSLSWNSNRFVLQCFRTAEMHNYHRHMMLNQMHQCSNLQNCSLASSSTVYWREPPDDPTSRPFPPPPSNFLSQGKGCVNLHQSAKRSPRFFLHPSRVSDTRIVATDPLCPLIQNSSAKKMAKREANVRNGSDETWILL